MRRIAPLVAVIAALAPGGSALAVWSHKTRLTRSVEAEDRPKVVAVGCTVHAVWIDTDNYDLHYARSADAGMNWTTPRTLVAGDPAPVLTVEIAAEGRTVHLLWQQGAYDQARIYYGRSASGGESWQAAVRLTSEERTGEQPSIAVHGDRVSVAWIQTRRGSDTKPMKLFFVQSTDGGRDWLPARRIDRRSLGLSTPLLSADGNRLYLFWGRRVRQDDAWTLEILHRSSDNGGRTWSPRRRAVEGGWRPASVATYGDTLHLLWEDARYKLSFINYQHSRDGGRTWTPPQTLDEASFASLGVSGAGLEAVWIRDWDGTGGMFFGHSRDGGQTWPIRRQIARRARFPALAVASGGGSCSGVTHVVYGKDWLRSGTLLQEIFHKRNPKIIEHYPDLLTNPRLQAVSAWICRVMLRRVPSAYLQVRLRCPRSQALHLQAPTMFRFGEW